MFRSGAAVVLMAWVAGCGDTDTPLPVLCGTSARRSGSEPARSALARRGISIQNAMLRMRAENSRARSGRGARRGWDVVRVIAPCVAEGAGRRRKCRGSEPGSIATT
jgi:hypothetical protein